MKTITYFAVAPASLGGGLPALGWGAGLAPAARVRDLDGITTASGTGMPIAGPAVARSAAATGVTAQRCTSERFHTTNLFGTTTQDAVAASDVEFGFHLRGRPPV